MGWSRLGNGCRLVSARHGAACRWAPCWPMMEWEGWRAGSLQSFPVFKPRPSSPPTPASPRSAVPHLRIRLAMEGRVWGPHGAARRPRAPRVPCGRVLDRWVRLRERGCGWVCEAERDTTRANISAFFSGVNAYALICRRCRTRQPRLSDGVCWDGCESPIATEDVGGCEAVVGAGRGWDERERGQGVGLSCLRRSQPQGRPLPEARQERDLEWQWICLDPKRAVPPSPIIRSDRHCGSCNGEGGASCGQAALWASDQGGHRLPAVDPLRRGWVLRPLASAALWRVRQRCGSWHWRDRRQCAS